jgi:Tol biopolymer transport system component
MRNQVRVLALRTLAAAATLLAACNDGGDQPLEYSFSQVVGAEPVELPPDAELNLCCDDPATSLTLWVMGVPEDVQFDGDPLTEDFPTPDIHYLGFSLKDVDPLGALAFRWDGPFIADMHREENAHFEPKPFDPEDDVGEPSPGAAHEGHLYVSAARCDFVRATFTMVIFEFVYLADLKTIRVLQSRERTVEIVNDCYDPAPEPPPVEDGRIVFANTPAGGGHSDIYTIDPSTGDLGRLTDNGSVSDDEPAWSPDRSRIAFRSNRGDAQGDFDLYLMRPDGNGQEQVTLAGMVGKSVDDPAWSPRGDRIAVSLGATGYPADIWIVDLATNPATLRQLTFQAPQGPAHYDSSPTWSEDGTHVWFTRSGLIYDVLESGGNPSLVLSPPNGNDSISAIDSSAAGIVFAYYAFAENHMRLAWWKGLGLTAVTFGGASHDDQPSWSPARNRAVFVRRTGETDRRLFVVDVDDASPHGGQEIQAQPAGSNQDPDWGFSPAP